MSQILPSNISTVKSPGFVVIYRWRLKPGKEEQFRIAWSQVTQSLLLRGSQGSRLHRSHDGLWYAYAQWPSATAREYAFAQPATDTGASNAMKDAIEEYFPEIVLDVVADFLVD